MGPRREEAVDPQVYIRPTASQSTSLTTQPNPFSSYPQFSAIYAKGGAR